MTFFIVSTALLGLFVGSVLATWIDRLPYEDIETSVRLPALGAPPMQPGRTRAGRRSRASRKGVAVDPWLRRRQRYLERNRFMEEDYQRLPWYSRFPLLSLFFGPSELGLKWYDKVPLLPFFVYAVKFSNYRALRPGAACLHCGLRFGLADYLPLASILRNRLRCRACGGKQSWVRPLIELVTALLFGLLAWRFGPTWLLVGYLLLGAAFVVCATVDWQFQIIPDEINTIGVVLGVAYCGLTQALLTAGWIDDGLLARWLPPDYDRSYGYITLIDSAAGFVVGGGALLALGRIGTWIAGTDALGGGDIKLAGFIGAFLGWRYVLIALFYSALVGAVAGGLVLWLGRGQKEHGYTKFAFGPYICLGTLLVMFFGAETMFYFYMGFNNWVTSRIAQWLFPATF
ncbi:MAG: prepilin peptidase [Candidatus Wallbacteria bacterium]|nr:prepilin peptidase [Candidatus Wallbacteria bacterium]